MWLSGVYPRALDGLCKVLSLDMRVIDPAWIGMKLRKLLNFGEPLGSRSGARARQRQDGELPLDGLLRREADHPPLCDARHPRRKRLSDIAHGGDGCTEEEEQGRRTQDAGRQTLLGMPQRHADQEGRLRVLHQLRRDRHMRVKSVEILMHDPHVQVMNYEVSSEEWVTYQNPKPISFSNELGAFDLGDKSLELHQPNTFLMKWKLVVQLSRS